jgi:hypothetical protein
VPRNPVKFTEVSQEFLTHHCPSVYSKQSVRKKGPRIIFLGKVGKLIPDYTASHPGILFAVTDMRISALTECNKSEFFSLLAFFFLFFFFFLAGRLLGLIFDPQVGGSMHL